MLSRIVAVVALLQRVAQPFELCLQPCQFLLEPVQPFLLFIAAAPGRERERRRTPNCDCGKRATGWHGEAAIRPVT